MAPTLYEILEVSPGCSEVDLKKSFRRLSLVHHPDRPGGDSAKFQELNNAYEILSDPEKRGQYDEFGDEPQGRGAGRGNEDVFNSFFGGDSRPRKQPKRQTPPSRCAIPISLEELYKGKEVKLEIERERKCGTCSGSGAKPNTKRRQCVPCEGQGVVYVLRHMGNFITRIPTHCADCSGTGSRIRQQDLCKKCRGKRIVKEKKRVEFFVERGMHPDDTVVLKGEGDELPDSSAPGDLYISLTLAPHPTFTLSPPSSTRAADLRTTLSLTLSESLLGFSRLILTHLDGRGLTVTQPAPGQRGWKVLKSGDELRIKGEGMMHKGEKGDLLLLVEVEAPTETWAKNLGEERLATLASLLPPKRADVPHPAETDQVTMDRIGSKSSHFSSAHQPGPQEQNGSDEEEDDEEGQPGCQQM